jgi:hypothetical protein
MDCTCNYCGKVEHNQLILWNICLDCQKNPNVLMLGKKAAQQGGKADLTNTSLCTCLYEVDGNDMSLDPDCLVRGSHNTDAA